MPEGGEDLQNVENRPGWSVKSNRIRVKGRRIDIDKVYPRIQGIWYDAEIALHKVDSSKGVRRRIQSEEGRFRMYNTEYRSKGREDLCVVGTKGWEHGVLVGVAEGTRVVGLQTLRSGDYSSLASHTGIAGL